MKYNKGTRRIRSKGKWHKGSDAWGRGSYYIPSGSVAGSSDTGNFPDSPCPSTKVKHELSRFKRVLKSRGIPSRTKYSRSGNVFMIKRWVVVPPKYQRRGQQVFNKWIKRAGKTTEYIHDAKS